MGLESGTGGGGGGTGKKKPSGGGLIVTAPGGRTGSTAGGSIPAGTSAGDKKPGKDPGLQLAQNAAKRESQYRKSAATRYADQAQNLAVQAAALRHAIRKDFKHSRDIKLGNITRVLRDQDALLLEGYHDRVGSLARADADNEKAQALQSGINQNNLTRERNNAVSEAMLQGSGESDLLKSQLMSLRNWQANAAEIERNYQDGLSSINSSLTDLTVDTKTARENAATQANADREQIWTNFYDRTSEAYTQLGNTYGQQADYWAMSKEMGGKKAGKREKSASGRAKDAFMDAAHASGQAWRNPGTPDRLQNWDGRPEFGSASNASKLASAQTVRLDKKPEGATLRKW